MDFKSAISGLSEEEIQQFYKESFSSLDSVIGQYFKFKSQNRIQKNKIDELTQLTNAKDVEIYSLKKQIEELTGTSDQLSSEVLELNQKMEALQKKNNDFSSPDINLQTEVDALKQELAETKQRAKDRICELKEENSSLPAQISKDMNKNLQTVRDKLCDLSASAATIGEKIAASDPSLSASDISDYILTRLSIIYDEMKKLELWPDKEPAPQLTFTIPEPVKPPAKPKRKSTGRKKTANKETQAVSYTIDNNKDAAKVSAPPPLFAVMDAEPAESTETAKGGE